MKDTELDDIKSLSVEQLSELLGMHRETIYRLSRAGVIPAYKLNGGKWRYTVKDIKQFIAERKHTKKGGSAPEGEKGTHKERTLRYNKDTKRYERT